MQRLSAMLVALALLLLACVSSTTSAATATAAPAADHTDFTNCNLLADKSAERAKELGRRSVSYLGSAVNVTLVWGSEPAHAAAALLGALLRHVRLYRNVYVPHEAHPHATTELASTIPFSFIGEYTQLIIGVSTAWEPKSAPAWSARKGMVPGLAGPRLYEMGASPVPARRRLFAWLAPTARERSDACRDHVRWAFYANLTALADCDFIVAPNPQGNVFAVEVLGVGDCDTTLKRLEARANASKTLLHLRNVDRTDFVHTLQTTNRSFLFLDYDMWKGALGVSVVEPPPCVFVDYDCKQELDSAIAMRVADVELLMSSAPQLFEFVHDFKPSPESLRLILEQSNIEEAACEWLLTNKSYEISYGDRVKYDMSQYNLYRCLCEGDPDNDFFEELTNITVEDEVRTRSIPAGWNVTVHTWIVNCSNQRSVSEMLVEVKGLVVIDRLLGIVSMSVEGVAEASAAAAASHLPLMLADVVPEDVTDGARGATWRVAGRPRHIVRALCHFVRASGWTRVAVVSQTTKLAGDYKVALEDEAEIIIGNFQIPPTLTKQKAQAVLQQLQDTNARIVFVNADSQAAHTILTAAVARGMGYLDGFVWIMREWRQNNVTCATKHFTVSFWARGVEDFPAEDGRAQLNEKLSKQWPRRPLPPRAVSLIDALLSLLIGFHDVYQRHPDLRHDLRIPAVKRSLEESLFETPVTGVSQRLGYKKRSLEEAFVFVDQWCGSEFKQRLATWRVNATSGVVRGKSEVRANYSRPADLPHDDGASGCIVRSGEGFDPTCHDTVCVCVLLLLVLAAGAVLLVRRAVRRHLARLLQEQQIQVITRRRHVTTVLAAYLVERTALELHEELGAGRFGSVCLARLREPGRAPRIIAAKALRDNAAPTEESEFLREACMIASLEHPHIVRLVGVCIVDGPPLVLMELAFFGDLLGYLRARRHLVEGAGSEEPAESGEAHYVSAEALTRLAREAAEALQYLGVRGVVHRDVRAANCLVDVRRSLKLADFGMARDTVAGADGLPEYSCRRRGMFPVLWMAPESLVHGVFSGASDVWALGVLVLELVTLGVRPYGTMSPLRVLEYVAAGGSPPLPLDATPQTRGLARLCWARAAERRPSAAEVAAYLAAWPLVLRPALLGERVEPADADSGFGESPSTELLPPDSPLHAHDQVEDLAATH